MIMARCLGALMISMVIPEKIVHCVRSELKALKPLQEGESKGFIRMLREVEQCWCDFKKLILNLR